MKMSDVFTWDEINHRGWLDLALTGARSDDALNAAYIAVRDHDALTQLNKELVELITEMNEGYSADIRADELIKRAKELAK